MKRFGGGIEFEPDIAALIAKALDKIDAKREALGLAEYDPARFGQSGDRLIAELGDRVAEAALAGAHTTSGTAES